MTYDEKFLRRRKQKKLLRAGLFIALAMALSSFITAWVLTSGRTAENPSQSYSKYLQEIFQTLRAEKKVHLVRLAVPAKGPLNRKLANSDHRRNIRLPARRPYFTVYAVSRNAKSFLDKMRVLYWENLDGVSTNWIPLKSEDQSKYVFVPVN